MYSITPKLQEKLEWLHRHCYRKTTLEKTCEREIFRIKPFYDFHSFCRSKDGGPYNPDQQWYYMRVYDRDDTLSKEEYEQLREVDKVKYILYHKWKNGEVTKKQCSELDWFNLMFGDRI